MSVERDISKTRYEELSKNPVFFLKLNITFTWDNSGYNEKCSWDSLDKDLNIRIESEDFGNKGIGYALCIIDGAKEKRNEEGKVIPDTLTMTIHNADPNSVDDWVCIFRCYVIRSQIPEDKYAFMEMLWALGRLEWDKRTVVDALNAFPTQTVLFLTSHFQRLGRCLSYSKQMKLKEVCQTFNAQYEIHSPESRKNAFENLAQRKTDYNNLNLFEVVDAIYESGTYNDEPDASSLFARLKVWYLGEIVLDDYADLTYLFPFLKDEQRLGFLKRYFHDIRMGRTTFDINILQGLRDNKYDVYTRYRYCLETPSEPVTLTVPLLCDALITLYSTNGAAFQTFEGILDFAMTRCDTVHPAIDFKMNRFLPTCDGGAVYNEWFKGFIDYSIIRRIDERKITDEHLRATLTYLMDKYGSRQQYPVCLHGDGEKIPDELFQNCRKQIKYKTMDNGRERETNIRLHCYRYVYYEDRWFVKAQDVKGIRDFLIEPNLDEKVEYSISLDMMSVDKLKAYILALPQRFEALEGDEFVVPSYSRKDLDNHFFLYVLQEYSEALRMRIFPQKRALVGLQFDVFDYWKRICEEQTNDLHKENNWIPSAKDFKYEVLKEKTGKRFREEEAAEVEKRCIEALKDELHTELVNESYFELPFDRDMLDKTNKRFYHKESFQENEPIHFHEFLRRSSVGKFKLYCAPQFSEAQNPAIKLPYFWCRGKECFHNVLGNQTLAEENDWRKYSIFHLIEIMGFPKLHKTDAGYEPDEIVKQFIAVTNKVLQKFRRLKCRACGHLLFTYNSTSGINQYNYYACKNPTCPEVGRAVYLNYCFKCKTGLIDSRDSKRCPNEWYICPSCLACCDDELYERQAQKYILKKRPVPYRVESKRGLGHNNHGLFFCPQCGTQLTEYHGQLVCEHCNKEFEDNH